MSDRRRWAAWARAALIAFGFSPLAAAALRDLPLFGRISDVADVWFTFQCQRDAARGLSFLPALPVCSRCFGIYLGLGLGAMLLRPELSPARLRLWVALAALAMGLDVATELFEMRPPSAALRFATGLFLAYPVGAALVRALRPPEASLRTSRR